MDNKTHYVDRYIQRDPEWKRKKLLIEYFPTKRLSISQNSLHTTNTIKIPLYFENRTTDGRVMAKYVSPKKLTKKKSHHAIFIKGKC